jgi:putative endonuclease
MPDKKLKAYEDGLRAETLSALLLRLKGYRILKRRYKTRVGEIDLIAKRGRTIAFVEVKTRASLDSALQSVTPHMQNRIARAALAFIAQNPGYADYDLRFDLIAASLPFYWRHLDNAWRPST